MDINTQKLFLKFLLLVQFVSKALVIMNGLLTLFFISSLGYAPQNAIQGLIALELMLIVVYIVTWLLSPMEQTKEERIEALETRIKELERKVD